MKKYFFYFIGILITKLSYASTIPNYQIVSIVDGAITLSNGAVFLSGKISRYQLSFWAPGDMITLDYPTPFSGHTESIEAGEVVSDPFFSIKKISSGIGIPFYLTIPATLAGAGTPSIINIDLTNNTITLSDATIWQFSNSSDDKVIEWDIGDLVMIGHNLHKLTSNDAILFDMDKQSVIPAHQ